MMEKLLDDAEEWEQHHMDTWLGRIGGSLGGATSAQLELMSPLSAIEFTKDPSLFNLVKASYGPGIAMGGYSWVSHVTGQKIYLGERIVHSADMARRTVSGGLRAGASVVAGVARPITAGALVLGLYWGADWLLSQFNPNLGILPDENFMRWTRYG